MNTLSDDLRCVAVFVPTFRELLKHEQEIVERSVNAIVRPNVNSRLTAGKLLGMSLVLLAIVTLAGCGSKLGGLVPEKRDFMVGVTPESFDKAMDAQERFERLRADIGVSAAEAESRIRNQESVVDTCRWLGFLLIPSGIVIAIWLDRKMGIAMSIAGAGSLMLAMFVGGFWFNVLAGGVAIGGILIGGAAAIQKLIMRWQERKEAGTALQAIQNKANSTSSPIQTAIHLGAAAGIMRTLNPKADVPTVPAMVAIAESGAPVEISASTGEITPTGGNP